MFTVGEVLNGAWEKFKANAGVMIGALLIAMIVPIVINFALSLVLGLIAGKANSIAVVLVMQLVIAAVGMVVNAFFMLGIISIVLKILRGEPAEIGMLFGQADKLLQGLIATIVITIGITIGMILLIIPGILFGMLTSLTMWYVCDKELDAITAIKASIEATKPALLNIFLWGLAMFVLSLLAMCTLGLGFLILGPVIYMALDKSAGQAEAF